MREHVLVMKAKLGSLDGHIGDSNPGVQNF